MTDSFFTGAIIVRIVERRDWKLALVTGSNKLEIRDVTVTSDIFASTLFTLHSKLSILLLSSDWSVDEKGQVVLVKKRCRLPNCSAKSSSSQSSKKSSISRDPLHKWRLHLNNNTYTSLASHS